MLFGRLARGLALLGALASSWAHALTVSPGSIALQTGQSQVITVGDISRSVSVTISNSRAVRVYRLTATSYRIDAVSAGQALVQFRDRIGRQVVSVQVSASPSANLNGRLLASNCFQCHGTNGSGGFDKLAGSSANEIYGELKKFASGAEDPNGIMAAHAMGLSDEQMRAVAQYFSNVR